MLLGKIQSGKTRAFLGIIALAFDKGFDVAIVLTKGTRTLGNQTVSRIARAAGGTNAGKSRSEIAKLASSVDRFTAETARKTGRTERAVQRDAERGSRAQMLSRQRS